MSFVEKIKRVIVGSVVAGCAVNCHVDVMGCIAARGAS